MTTSDWIREVIASASLVNYLSNCIHSLDSCQSPELCYSAISAYLHVGHSMFDVGVMHPCHLFQP